MDSHYDRFESGIINDQQLYSLKFTVYQWRLVVLCQEVKKVFKGFDITNGGLRVDIQGDL